MTDQENPNSTLFPERPSLEETKRRPGTSNFGIKFEEKTLMLVLYQACKYGLDFTLDTNVDEYGAFDDIVFVSKNRDGSDELRIFAKLKHTTSDRAIYYNSLLGATGKFSLYNFFIDYIDTIFKKHKNDEHYWIILTNMDFKWPSDEDKGRIIRNTEDVARINRKLEEGARINRKTEEDEYFVLNKLETLNCKALAVFDPLNMKNSIIEKWEKNSNETDKRGKNPSFYQFSDETYDGQRNTDRVLEIFKKKFMSIDEEKPKGKQKLQFYEKDKLHCMLEKFLKSLIFATNTYYEATLENLIIEKLKQSHPEYLSPEVENVFWYVFDKIDRWKDRRSALPLTKENNYFKEGFELSDNIKSRHLFSKYESELSSSTIRFKQQVYKNIEDFFTSGKQLWHIFSEGPWLNSLPIYQALNQMTLDEKSKVNYSSRDHHIFLTGKHLTEGHQFFQSLFENMKESILVIACTSNDLKDRGIYEMLDMIAKIVFESAKYRKQIILIAPCELASELPNFTRLSVFSYKTRDINFDHLTEKAQDDFINKKNIRFQGNEELSIKELMRLEEGRCVSNAIKELKLDTLELEKLIKSDSVEIGNEPPEFSELDSIHIKPLSLIKERDLQRAIVNLQDTNSHLQDIFVFVGTETDVKKLLPEDEKPVTFENVDLSNVSDFWPPSKRFILLERDDEEDKQFKQLCRLINKVYSRRLVEVLPVPTLHLLRKRKKEWIWMRSYSRELYIHRNFYPSYIDKFTLIDLMLGNSLLCPVERETNKKIPLESCVLDFIIVSEIEPRTFLDSLDIDSREVQKQIQEFVKRTSTAELNTDFGRNSEREYSLNFNNDYEYTVFLENLDAQEKFQKLSKDIANQGQSVHWLKAVNDNGQIRFQWYRSEGEIMGIRSVLDDERKNYIREEDLLNDNSPIIVIADESGMGKSTTLVSMAEMTKKSNTWVIKIDLNQHQKTLAERVKSRSRDRLKDLMDFLSTDEKFRDSLTRKIFIYKLNRPGQVLFLCDGFDEVKRERHEAVLRVLRFLRRKTEAKICITTRSYCKEKFEENLSVLAHLFQPIGEEQQINFLNHFWKEALKLTINTDLSVLEEKEYARKIIKKLDCILDDRSSFISVPLRARMLAEIFRETIENALKGDKTAVKHINSREKVSIGNLYNQFIQKKYEIYFYEKIGMRKYEGFDEELEFLMNFYTEIYGVLAVEKVFGCKIAEDIANIYNIHKKKFSFSKLSQIGLIQGNDAAYDFIHRTFAEYFAGRWLAVSCQTSDARKIICEKLLMKEYKVPRYFFDYFMSASKFLHRAVLQGNGSKFSKFLRKNTDVSHKDNLGRTALHLAAQEGRLKMIVDLRERGLGLDADETGKTPLHYLAVGNSRKKDRVDALLKGLIDIKLDDHIFQSPLHFDTETVYTSIFEKSVCENSMFVETVNKRDGAGKSAVQYAAEHHHWVTACMFVLHGADISCLTEEQKNGLYQSAYAQMHRNYDSKNYLSPVLLLSASRRTRRKRVLFLEGYGGI